MTLLIVQHVDSMVFSFLSVCVWDILLLLLLLLYGLNLKYNSLPRKSSIYYQSECYLCRSISQVVARFSSAYPPFPRLRSRFVSYLPDSSSASRRNLAARRCTPDRASERRRGWAKKIGDTNRTIKKSTKRRGKKIQEFFLWDHKEYSSSRQEYAFTSSI